MVKKDFAHKVYVQRIFTKVHLKKKSSESKCGLAHDIY